MAEAHSAVAFSFSVTPEGVDVNVNHEAIWAIFYSGVRSWKKRVARIKNRFHNGVYPASPASLLITVSIVLGIHLANTDPSWGLIQKIQHMPGLSSLSEPIGEYLSCIIFATILWVVIIQTLQYILKALLTYQAWMFEPRGKMKLKTKIWLGIVKLLGSRSPKLYSWQGSLPKMPVPKLTNTMQRYLQSVRPLLDDEKYTRMERLAKEFASSIGPKLQRYLSLKSWWATNYVSDWWEEYVYLRGRSPIMVNSNFYGVDAILRHPTTFQTARAANIIYAMLQFRKHIEREEMKPILLNKTVPLCSAQYERQFNTCRIPGIETDKLVHYQDSRHIVVYHHGRYFKVYIHYKGKLLTPPQIEIELQKIIDDQSIPVQGEEHLAALTAGDRIPWAQARIKYFNKGVNKTSLDAIERAAFFVSLDDEAQTYDPNDPTKLDRFGLAMLHGNCYNRWFDKSFTLVVTANGRIGFNGEHSWADAPITGHLWESAIADDIHLGYREDGHTKGEPDFQPPNPIRLQWDIPKECEEVIESSLSVAQSLAEDVDLYLMMHDAYGKGFMKKARTSPDAFIQMALQLAYYRDAGKFCLTYEASMTRMYREGRTETVRSCTIDSSNFVRAMDDKTKTNKERIALLKKAADAHQQGYRLAMTSEGIDRHLFCLYVVSKYLGIDSPFLKEVLSEPWRLSTSQTPHQQTEKLDLSKHPDCISAGGGFGPVADDGYGVSYIIAGEDTIFFHISSKKSCPLTASHKFGARITKALQDLKNLFEQ